MRETENNDDEKLKNNLIIISFTIYWAILKS